MDESVIIKTSKYFKDKGIILPTIRELSNPHEINTQIRSKLKSIKKNAANPLNLFRVHWYNSRLENAFSEVP